MKSTRYPHYQRTVITTAAGVPITGFHKALSDGPRASLLADHKLLEKMARFKHEYTSKAIDPSMKKPPLVLWSDVGRFNHHEFKDDHQQAGDLYRRMSSEEKSRLVDNLVDSLKSVPRYIQAQQLADFIQADADFGQRIAAGLGLRHPHLGRRAA